MIALYESPRAATYTYSADRVNFHPRIGVVLGVVIYNGNPQTVGMTDDIRFLFVDTAPGHDDTLGPVILAHPYEINLYIGAAR